MEKWTEDSRSIALLTSLFLALKSLLPCEYNRLGTYKGFHYSTSSKSPNTKCDSGL